MKAVAFEHHGNLDVLQWMDLPDPRPTDGEVLIKVEACGVNHLDVWMREGWPGLHIPMPHISGCEVVGTIAELGKNVRGWNVGQRVLVSPGLSCRQCDRCRTGHESLCSHFGVMGFIRQGGYAELTTAPADELVAIGDEWTPEEWAATPLVFLTAWHMLVSRAKLKKGETVLIHAAGSGIGTAGIQVAKYLGARVITTAGSDEKLDKAKKLGADETVNYTTHPEFHKEVKRLTDGKGCDIVYEHIGPATWTSSSASLAIGGRIVFCGVSSGPKVELDLRFTFMRQHSILGSYMGDKHELLTVIDLLKKKKLHPVVDTIFPLKEAKAAQSKMLSRNFFGKLVFKV